MQFDRRASVKDMIESLGVPHAEVAGIFINGVPVGFRHIVGDGERIDVYPSSGIPDAAVEVLLRPPLPDVLRFVLDSQLGTLARYLRLYGFDALYRNDYADAEVAAISAEQERILLTRDRGVLKRRIVVHGYFVRHDQPREQLVEVVDRFDLVDRARPFTRCARCNGLLQDVSKEAVLHRLEPLTRKHFTVFRQCTDCGKVYWRGSHHAQLRQLLDVVGRR